MLRMCKEHQTTVKGVVQTAAGVAMVTILEMDEYEAESNVTGSQYQTIPEVHSIPNDHAGAFFSLLQASSDLRGNFKQE